MADSISVEQRTSWGSRIGNSFKGIAVGVVFGLVGIGLLVWNEGNFVRQHKALEEGLKMVVEIPIQNLTTIDPTNDGNLVHIVGSVQSNVNISDSVFGVDLMNRAIKLNRDTEIYQWVEDEEHEEVKHAGGSTTTKTTYTYHKKWVSQPVDSESFHDLNDRHVNPSTKMYESKQFVSTNVTVGPYPISTSPVLDKISWFVPLENYKFSVDTISDENLRRQHVRVIGNGFYIGRNPDNPDIGDQRVTYEVIQSPQTVSIIARQYAGTLTIYTARNGGGRFVLVEPGVHDPEEMFTKAQGELRFLTWILRAVGCICIYVMFQSFAGPLVAFSDVLPFLGNIVEVGTSCISFLLTLIVGTTVIALAWLAYRPILSMCLFGIVGFALYMIHHLYGKTKTVPYESIPSETPVLQPPTYPIAVDAEPIPAYAFVEENDIPVATMVGTTSDPYEYSSKV